LAKCRKNHLWVLDQYVSLCKTLRHAVSYSHTILPFL
jgi:hypothetical protein